MPRFFLDTSALAKRYIREEGTPRILEMFKEPGEMVVSALAFVEVTSAAVRRANANDIDADHLDQVLTTLETEFRTRFAVIELRGAVITRSADLVRTHNLRAADAIQLACALAAVGREAGKNDVIVVSADTELNRAAIQEGLTIMDPTAA